MVSANDLDRPSDLLQCCVVERRFQDFERVEKCRGLFRGYSSPAFAHQQRIQGPPLPRTPVRLPSSRSSTPIDESVCSSGKHHDKVIEASTTMQLQDAPRGGVRGSSFRRARGDGLSQNL